jgi:hypothetical protein
MGCTVVWWGVCGAARRLKLSSSRRVRTCKGTPASGPNLAASQGCHVRCAAHSRGVRACARVRAPQVFLCRPYDEAADVFSLGVVMYEVFHR